MALQFLNNGYFAGKVGIGTETLSTKLTISGQQELLQLTRGGASDTKWFFSADAAKLYIAEDTSATANIKLTIVDTGNVGIGTITPGAKLHVSGSVQLDVMPTNQSEGSIKIGRYDANTSRYNLVKNFVSATAASNYMRFAVHNGTENATVDVMSLNGAGNVGIGSEDPVTKLELKSPTVSSITNDRETTTSAFVINGSNENMSLQFGLGGSALNYGNWIQSGYDNGTPGSSPLYLNPIGGNVGIGTDSPGAKLEVSGSLFFRDFVRGYVGSSTTQYVGATWLNASDGVFYVRSADVNKVVLDSNGDSYLNGGNVGINATIPSEKLDVDGNVRVRNLTAGIVTSSATGVLSTGGPTPMNMSLGEGYAGNIREKYYRTNKTVYPSAIGSQYAQLIQQGIFNSMSLIMSPIATETAVVSSPAPNDGSGDFSFNRNSPGSRVGSDGYIVRETQNLFIQSNDMSASSAWTLGDATLTGGQTGYTGAPNAWRLNDNATDTTHIIRQTPGFGGTVTVSIYAKAGTKDYLFIRGVTQGASNQYTYFKLTDGTLGTVQGITAFMEAAGGGWYRCSVTYDHNPAYEYYFGMTNTDNDPTYAGDGTGNIYFMNPQLENGIGAREYIPTTTVVKYAGITTNVPRIDYLNNIPELLIEPNSTNVVYDGSHMAGLTAITESFSLSPEGIINGIKINETATTGQHYGHVNCSVVSGTQYFLSVYMKKGTSSFSDIHTQSNTISTSARINFDNVTIAVSGGTEGFIYEVGGGWYRVGYKTTAATQNNTSMDIYLTISSLGSYAGNVNNYTEYYGIQLETSSILTSLIQTYSGAVTRAHEQISLSNMASNNIAGNATNGTLMMEFSNHYNSIAGDTIRFHQSSTITGRGYLYVRQMGFADTWGSAGLSVTDNVLSKAIWRLNSLTDGSFFLNGVKGNNVSGTAWGNIDKLVVFGNFGTMRIRNIFFAPLALTDTQCVTLTTINE